MPFDPAPSFPNLGYRLGPLRSNSLLVTDEGPVGPCNERLLEAAKGKGSSRASDRSPEACATGYSTAEEVVESRAKARSRYKKYATETLA
jgi:hypothetical protein